MQLRASPSAGDFSWKELVEEIQTGAREQAQSVDNCAGDPVLVLSPWLSFAQ